MINKNILWLDVKDAAKKLKISDRTFTEVTSRYLTKGTQYLIIDYQKCIIAIIEGSIESFGKIIRGIQRGQELKAGTIIPVEINSGFDECFCFNISGNKIINEKEKTNMIKKDDINKLDANNITFTKMPILKIKANHGENIEKIIQKLKESRNKSVSNNPKESINLNEIINPCNSYQTVPHSTNLNETTPITTKQNQINLNLIKWQNELYSILF